MKEQLRLDYFLSLGMELVRGDIFNQNDYAHEVLIPSVMNLPAHGDSEITITSFFPRKNEDGKQPCDDVPLMLELKNGAIRKYPAGVKNWAFGWPDYGNGIKSWKPNLQELIKLQNEHDKNQEVITDPIEIAKVMGIDSAYESDEGTDVNNIKLPNDLKLVYTPEMKLINAKPEAGMKCRIEYMCNIKNYLVVDEAIYKSETDKEICLLDSNGYFLIVDKEEFVTYHHFDARTELEIAQEKQIDDLLPIINATGGDRLMNKMKLVALQKAGKLTEIILPLIR